MSLKEIYLPLIILITLSFFIKARQKFGFDFFFIFIIYLISNFLVELTSSISVHYIGNNMLLYNISMFTEGLTFCYVFYYINNDTSIKKAIIISGCMFFLFWIINFSFFQKNNSLDTYTYLFSSIILATFSLITIYQFIFKNSFNNPFHNFFFWISIGILFCYLGNIPYLASVNILAVNDWKTAISLNIISQVVNSILYLMIIIGCLQHQPNTKLI
jgi:hypothetical protein